DVCRCPRVPLNSVLALFASLREPCGDSRSQAFFFGRLASFAGRRNPAVGEHALLGLQRLGRDDPSLHGREVPAGLRGGIGGAYFGFCVFGSKKKKGRVWGFFRREKGKGRRPPAC